MRRTSGNRHGAHRLIDCSSRAVGKADIAAAFDIFAILIQNGWEWSSRDVGNIKNHILAKGVGGDQEAALETHIRDGIERYFCHDHGGKAKIPAHLAKKHQGGDIEAEQRRILRPDAKDPCHNQAGLAAIKVEGENHAPFDAEQFSGARLEGDNPICDEREGIGSNGVVRRGLRIRTIGKRDQRGLLGGARCVEQDDPIGTEVDARL